MGRVERTVAVLSAVAFAVVGHAVPAHAADAKPDSVVASVAPGSQTKAGYFSLATSPGSTTTQTVIIGNKQAHAVEAHVEAVNGFTSAATGTGFGTPGSPATGTASWVQVRTPVVTLQPGEQRGVDFTVRVPTDATPGIHLAGISASVPLSTVTTPTVANPRGATIAIKLQPQRVIAVEVIVPGLKAPRLAISGAHAIATPNGISLVLAMANTGNDYARGSAVITVPDTKLSAKVKLDTFVPGTKIQYTLPWTKDVVPGTHVVTAELRYGTKRLTWNGNVVINAATQRELQASLDKNRVQKSGGTFPWLLLLLGVGLAVLLALSLAVIRRRRGGAIRVMGAVAQPADSGDRDLSRI
ncbi:MAG: putative protein of unknown function cell surface [Actinomycetia bacterium]|nr:putative protein of unknown function cell surface [Actinomycetes bacterium]